LDVWLKQIAGGEPVRLTSGPDSKVNPQFSPDGTRIYFLGGRNDIYEVPALGGTSRKVFENAGPFSISSRGDIAFYRPGTGTSPGPMFVVGGGNSVAQAWHPECVSGGAPIWSPEGDRIAFLGGCGRPLGGTLVAPLSGGAVTELSRASLQTATSSPRGAWARMANGADGLIVPRQSGDSINLHFTSDGENHLVTEGTGLETWPVVSPSGDVIFMRAEQTPSVWSVPLSGDAVPSKEASPARMFATSRDGSKLVFGRMLGSEQGQLVLRDRPGGAETVLASHKVVLGGTGSLWPQVSPDGQQVWYRINTGTGQEQYLVSTAGGTPRRLAVDPSFALASDWSSDGKRMIGECRPLQQGICELLPDAVAAKPVLTDAAGAQLLYPSFSWDGRSVAFMHRVAGRTRVMVTPVVDGGTLGRDDRWVAVSPDDADGARPRFSPDSATLFYQLTHGNVVTIVRQRLDASTKRPIGAPVPLATVLNVPPSILNIGLQYVITVTRDRLFYNTAEIRSNVWMTRIE
jgi:Tol biopolymer transport system component